MYIWALDKGEITSASFSTMKEMCNLIDQAKDYSEDSNNSFFCHLYAPSFTLSSRPVRVF